MRKLIGHIVLFSLVISACWAATSDVQTIHYQSKKTSKIANQTIQTEMLVWMASQNVRIAIALPDKRDLVLSDNVVVVGAENEIVTYNYAEVPPVIKQMLIPTIFGAGTFMKSIQKGFTPKLLKTDKGLQYFIAESKRKKNISKVEYAFDTANNTLVSYKMYSISGALISEVQYFDYKVYAEQFLLPSHIKSMTTIKDGVLEDDEYFSRVKVNAPVDLAVFQLKGGDK